MSNEKRIGSKIPEIGDFVMQEGNDLIYMIFEFNEPNIRFIDDNLEYKSINQTAFSWEWHSDLTRWLIKARPQLIDIDKKFREHEPDTPVAGLLGSNNGVTTRKPGVNEGGESSTGGLNNTAGLLYPPRPWGSW